MADQSRKKDESTLKEAERQCSKPASPETPEPACSPHEAVFACTLTDFHATWVMTGNNQLWLGWIAIALNLYIYTAKYTV